MQVRQRKRIINSRGPADINRRMANMPGGEIWWVMVGNKVRKARSFMEYAEQTAQIDSRRVAQATWGDYWLSTVFLGLDHNYWGYGPPVLFESMLFGPGDDKFMLRYSTRKEAEAGHRRIVDAFNRVLATGVKPSAEAIELALSPDD